MTKSINFVVLVDGLLQIGTVVFLFNIIDDARKLLPYFIYFVVLLYGLG
jgi:hypothetical protein